METTSKCSIVQLATIQQQERKTVKKIKKKKSCGLQASGRKISMPDSEKEENVSMLFCQWSKQNRKTNCTSLFKAVETISMWLSFSRLSYLFWSTSYVQLPPAVGLFTFTEGKGWGRIHGDQFYVSQPVLSLEA